MKCNIRKPTLISMVFGELVTLLSCMFLTSGN